MFVLSLPPLCIYKINLNKQNHSGRRTALTPGFTATSRIYPADPDSGRAESVSPLDWGWDQRATPRPPWASRRGTVALRESFRRRKKTPEGREAQRQGVTHPLQIRPAWLFVKIHISTSSGSPGSTKIVGFHPSHHHLSS